MIFIVAARGRDAGTRRSRFFSAKASSDAPPTPGLQHKKPPLFKNLKVLPKDISEADLNKIMFDEVQDGLGVSCSFCHVRNKDGHTFDYAADDKPEKEIARKMMRMTIGINKKYFKVHPAALGDSLMVIQCATCHQGQPHPGDK